jgi:chaperonin GroEL
MKKLIHHNPLKMIAGVTKKYVDFLSPTYGPAGKKVLIIENEFSLKAVDDGHEAAKAFEMENELENAVALYIKEASERTNSRVGDGTTTAALITGSIVEQVLTDLDDPLADKVFHKQAVAIQKAAKEAVEYIKSQAKKVETQEELYKIAYNSFNNEELAKLISETLFKIGKDGVLTIDNSNGMTSSVEQVQGLELEKGYVSPYLVNTDKQEVVIKSPAIILINQRLNSFAEIAPFIKNLLTKTKEFVIIADGFADDVINNVVVRNLQGMWKANLVEIPGYGDNKIEGLRDIATITGATIIDPKNNPLDKADLTVLGSAEEIISKKDKTTIIGGKGTKEALNLRLETLNLYLEASSTDYDKERFKKRIAALNGGIAVLKVGANTENEQKSIKAKVEDAVNATRIAFKDGIVKGAGLCYNEINTSNEILNKALKAPREQLKKNGEEFLDENVYDPAGVLIAALESAVSIACGLITIGGISTYKRKEEKE